MHRQLQLACLFTSKSECFFLNVFLLIKNNYYRYKHMLDESGISVALPPCAHLVTSASLLAPPSPPSQHIHQQHCPEPPAGTNTNQLNKKKASDHNSKSSESSDSDVSTESSKRATKTSTTNNDDEHLENDKCDTDEGNFFPSLYLIYLNL